MSDFIPDRIAVTFKMTADDYARYFTVLSRHQSGRADLYAYIAALLGAIPVALLFRSIGARRLADSAAVELIGQFSLAAFLLGTVAIVVAALVARRIAVRSRRNAERVRVQDRRVRRDRGDPDWPDIAGELAMGRRQPIHQRKRPAPDLDRAINGGGDSPPEFWKQSRMRGGGSVYPRTAA